MSTNRIPYRPSSVLPAGIPPLNLFRMWAHSPSTLPHSISLGTACFRDTSLSPYLRELVCLLSARGFECDYLLRQHIQIARTTGVPEDQIAALIDGDLSTAVWTNEQKVLLAFLEEVIAKPEVSDKVFSNARMWFSDQALVEVVTMQGFYYSLAKVATVFRVEHEDAYKENARSVVDEEFSGAPS